MYRYIHLLIKSVTMSYCEINFNGIMFNMMAFIPPVTLTFDIRLSNIDGSNFRHKEHLAN